jgi:hypothetical protein
MCQVNVGGDNGIYCWNPDTGEVGARITGSFEWTGTSQRGLAYRPDDDSFYVGGWNEGVVYHVTGLASDEPGTVISKCRPPDPLISGLGWNRSRGVLWAATNSETDTIYQLNPDTCEVIQEMAPPDRVAFSGGGLEVDPLGNLWTMSQGRPSTAYLIDSGVPEFSDVPWLRTEPDRGNLPVGQSATVRLTIDTTGLEPGVYGAYVALVSNSGRQPVLIRPVRLVVPGYQVGLNSGGGAYTDGAGDTWAADRAFAAGGSGYLADRNRTESTRTPVAGTLDQPLFQNQRLTVYEYRFADVPNGVYAVDLDFAELRRTRPNTRLFDVIIEGQLLLPALDVANDVGPYAAMRHTLYVPVADGQLNVRLISRQGDTIINAIRVTQRPDRIG